MLEHLPGCAAGGIGITDRILPIPQGISKIAL
jgi:hypothetical protein